MPLILKSEWMFDGWITEVEKPTFRSWSKYRVGHKKPANGWWQRCAAQPSPAEEKRWPLYMTGRFFLKASWSIFPVAHTFSLFAQLLCHGRRWLSLRGEQQIPSQRTLFSKTLRSVAPTLVPGTAASFTGRARRGAPPATSCRHFGFHLREIVEEVARLTRTSTLSFAQLIYTIKGGCSVRTQAPLSRRRSQIFAQFSRCSFRTKNPRTRL